MPNYDKATKRIDELFKGELSHHDWAMRIALGRRLEVDARLRAIENYLNELNLSPVPFTASEFASEENPRTPERRGSGENDDVERERLLALSDQLKEEVQLAEREGWSWDRKAPLRAKALAWKADWDALNAPKTPATHPDASSLRKQIHGLQARLELCDEGDSAMLLLMRRTIDRIGWDDEEQREAGDYLARLKQIADDLPELREAKRDLYFAQSSTTQARDERDKALGIIEAARRLGTVKADDVDGLTAARERIAKAVSDFDLAEMPF